ncbi:MAG: sugar ABC transporter ATP-binding protein [Acetobacteraceae bacterium]|nr:sugar ABC transporter ATP-binding protein [Acetobacteraceae bacterium]
MSDGAPLLEVRRLSKSFPGTRALDGVDIAFRAGEVHALLGENGAGKSTLIKIMAGVYRADAGQVLWRGAPVQPETERLPIAFIHQDLGLVDTMTVAENIALIAGYPRRRGLIRWRAAEHAAERILSRMGGGVAPGARVGSLPAASKSIVAIARALSVRADLLVLDEPTAALPEADVARLLSALRRLRDEGIGIIYVTHRLDEVFRIADRVTVLRDGRRIQTGAVSETTSSALVQAIIGRRLDDLFADVPPPAPGLVLHVRDLVARHVGPVSFAVGPGEILGLVGLRGAGHDVVGRALFGDVRIDDGELVLNGAHLVPTGPQAAIARGIGFVSSKRREESVASGLAVRENLFMNPTLLGGGPLRPIGPARERTQTSRVLQRLSVRPPDTERPIVTLSGGNQQKVVVSRWMQAGSRLLVLEEPTFGVDVGSKAEIYGLLRNALANGLAVLLVSSDFEEVAGLCHRALVFDRGRVGAELRHPDLSVARLTEAASGAGVGRQAA